MLTPEEIETITKTCKNKVEYSKILIKYMHSTEYKEVIDLCEKVLMPIVNKGG
jgi:hypothetical protein